MGILRLQSWVADFNLNKQCLTNFFVCVFKLGWEYWDSNILMNVSRGVGVPLRVDKATLEGDFGYNARNLVDVDLSKDILYSL